MRTKQHNYNESGFTLIELMIVVAIIAILAAIAVPNYMSHIAKSRRADAQGALLSFANAMERYYTTNGTYQGATAATVFSATYPSDGSAVYYNLSVNTDTNSDGVHDDYTLTADATGSQEGDGNLQYTSTGVKRWDKNDDGDYGDTGETSWSEH